MNKKGWDDEDEDDEDYEEEEDEDDEQQTQWRQQQQHNNQKKTKTWATKADRAIMATNSHAIVNSILANGYSINLNGGANRCGKAKSFEMIAFTASRLPRENALRSFMWQGCSLYSLSWTHIRRGIG